MRLISSFLLPALCWRLASAGDWTGHIYIHNPDQSQEPRPSGTLSPIAARLVLAQRLGVEEFHSADMQDRDVVGAINDYGMRTPIFSDQREAKMRRALLYIEGEDNKQYLDKHFPTNFAISHEPSSQSAWELYSDLEAQSLSTAHHAEFASFLVDEHQDSEIESTILRLKNSNTAITILYLPPTPRMYGAGAEWGTYRMPNTPSLLRKRSEPPEKPLEQAPDSFQPVESSTSPLTILASDPLPGILPACFPSESSCNELTRNCTGHGKCSLKYIDTSPDPAKSCYTCQCTPTVRESADGKVQTTYWGGPACQKRDVSVQFWLIALFSVGMVGLISFAVGQVWSMGDEELPSVIGAGVSGPVARR